MDRRLKHAPDPARASVEVRLAGRREVVLDKHQRAAVRDAIIEHCPFRSVRLLALSVRTNHVHLVVTPSTKDPAMLAGRFRAWCTRRLRERSLIDGAPSVWTQHASTRCLFFPEAVAGAMRCVLEQQGPPDAFTVRGEYPAGGSSARV